MEYKQYFESIVKIFFDNINSHSYQLSYKDDVILITLISSHIANQINMMVSFKNGI